MESVDVHWSDGEAVFEEVAALGCRTNLGKWLLRLYSAVPDPAAVYFDSGLLATAHTVQVHVSRRFLVQRRQRWLSVVKVVSDPSNERRTNQVLVCVYHVIRSGDRKVAMYNHHYCIESIQMEHPATGTATVLVQYSYHYDVLTQEQYNGSCNRCMKQRWLLLYKKWLYESCRYYGDWIQTDYIPIGIPSQDVQGALSITKWNRNNLKPRWSHTELKR